MMKKAKCKYCGEMTAKNYFDSKRFECESCGKLNQEVRD